MDDRFTFEQHALAIPTVDGRPIAIVEHSLDEIAGWEQVFQTLLILNADQVAAEVIGDADGGDIHFALQQDLCVREIGGMRWPGVEPHAFAIEPSAYLG